MASSVCTEDEDGPGQVVVRRFTDELVGTSSLEKATKEVQGQLDDDAESKQRARLTSLYDELGDDD